MRIGFNLPQFGPGGAHVDDLLRFAAQAEEHGADSFWVGDRLLVPVEPTVNYPGVDYIPSEFRISHDPLTLLTAVAGVTTRARLGTSTLNAPWYPAAILARQAATLDQLSGGRLLLGLGSGWMPEEYAAVGVPMNERGARLDELLSVLATWWHDDPVAYEGRFQTIAPSHVDVKPHGIPTYLAGFAPTSQRRIAERADGFLPVVVPAALDDLDAAVNTPWQRLRDAAVAAGRPADAIGAVLRLNLDADTTAAQTAAMLRRIAAETDVPDTFVDPIYLNLVGDAASRFAADVLDAAR